MYEPFQVIELLGYVPQSGNREAGMQKRSNVFETIRGQTILRPITGLLFLLLGILLSDIPAMILSPGWPTTEGIIISSRLLGISFEEYDGDYYTETKANIRYQYMVDGVDHTSSAINAIDSPFFLYPRGYTNRYPEGKDVTVFFNPGNPAQSVLEPGIVYSFGAFDIFSSLPIGVGFYLIVLSALAWVKANRGRYRGD